MDFMGVSKIDFVGSIRVLRGGVNQDYMNLIQQIDYNPLTIHN